MARPAGGQPDQDHAAVVGRPLALDQAAFFQFVEQAGDVGRAGYQPRGQRQGGQLATPFAAQQPQRVVLLRREVVALEQLFLDQVQAIVGSPQVEKSLLFERIEVARMAGGLFGGHIHACHANLKGNRLSKATGAWREFAESTNSAKRGLSRARSPDSSRNELLREQLRHRLAAVDDLDRAAVGGDVLARGIDLEALAECLEQVGHVHRAIFDGSAGGVGLADHLAAANSAAGQHGIEGPRIVVAARAGIDLRRAAELAHPHDQVESSMPRCFRSVSRKASGWSTWPASSLTRGNCRRACPSR